MKLMLVDGNNLLMRTIYATRRAEMSAQGVNTGPLAVFISTLARHVREERPDSLVIAWDGGYVERTAVDAGYKANRREAPDEDHELKRSAFALTWEFCALANLFSHRQPGVEADDLIAGYWAGWSPPPSLDGVPHQIVIASSDKDFAQLLGQSPRGVTTEQLRFTSPGTPADRWTADTVEERFDCPPSEVPAMFALAGDSSDNVIGIYGIGPKKAVKALKEHDWDFTRTITARWPEEADRLAGNYRLVDLRGTAPLAIAATPPAFLPTRPEIALWAALESFLVKYELGNARGKLMRGTLWHELGAPGRALSLPTT